jgi:phage shock protein PspC (stress-responsive transcriptional regulator)
MTEQPGPDQGELHPPPLTAFAWRHGLVRPTQGRLLAGVCGALGRATNTDPVLWRVLLAVLAIFGGIGVVVYLLGWLLLPADGDTGSPVEALLGRGHSATSPVLTVIGSIIVVFSFPVLIREPFRPGPWGVILVGGALLLLLRDRRRTGPAAPAPPTATASQYPTTTSGASMTSANPPTAAATAPTTPFAPYGPYAGATPPPYAPPPYAPPAPPPPRPPRPKRPRSRLGLLTFSVLLVVLGALGMTDLAGYSVPGPSYLAAALAVVGLGLVVGAWIGRARPLIAVGIVLMFFTAGASAATEFRHDFRAGDQTWVVSSFDQLRPSYEQQLGNATLDLSALDFASTQKPVSVDVSVDAGNLEIIVPDNVDVTVDAKIDLGNADVFDQSWGGIDPGSHSVTDYDSDGRGGGELRINASIAAGNLEVHR